MLFSDIEELIKRASETSSADTTEETEKIASTESEDSIDELVSEIEGELAMQLEKRASKLGIAKLMLAIDLLQ